MEQRPIIDSCGHNYAVHINHIKFPIFKINSLLYLTDLPVSTYSYQIHLNFNICILQVHTKMHILRNINFLSVQLIKEIFLNERIKGMILSFTHWHIYT